MDEARLLLCTDMDRTLIPNGAQPEHPLARVRFSEFCRLPLVKLAYVSGRHETLIKDAIREYSLPLPDYVISDVGTKIYRAGDGRWHNMNEWEEEIDKDWRGQDRSGLEELFADIKGLRLQEISKQNRHKLSYYIPLQMDQVALMDMMKERLEARGVKGSLVWSVDEPEGIGLLDILPLNATKFHAIEFLKEHLGYSNNEILFAGDSGNDLAVMGSPIPSVLVANAEDDVRTEALKLAAENGNSNKLYLASGEKSDMGGNYSAGILEGVGHFMPSFRSHLEDKGFTYGN